MCSVVLALSPFGVPALAQDHTDSSARTSRSALAGLQEAFSAIADELEPAVVTVSTIHTVRSPEDGEDLPRGILPLDQRPHRSNGTGTGVIIRKEGWVLTNDHVVSGADKVTVRLHDGREFIGDVRRDVRSDLALIKISSPTPLPVARLGDSDKVKIGHWAIAIGSPYRHEGTLSVGVISSLSRRQEILDSGVGRRFYPSMIQTDAAINPGNSGGPLCNIDGEVIGINTAIESEHGGSIGIGFAIPINSAKFVIDQLLAKGHVDYGFLGINPTSVTPRQASALKVDEGALLEEEPADGTPAAKAGLHAGDVITAIDTQPIRNELDLRTIVAHTAPNTTIHLKVVRDGQPRDMTAVLEAAREITPPEKARAVVKSNLGIEVQALTRKLAEQAGVPTETPGVLVKSIDYNSDAADIEEMEEGRAVILRVNGVDTPTVQAFQTVAAGLKSGDHVKIIYLYRPIEQQDPIKRFAVISIP